MGNYFYTQILTNYINIFCEEADLEMIANFTLTWPLTDLYGNIIPNEPHV